MNYKIEFNPDGHIYKVNGIVRLSVTQIIKPFFADLSFVPQEVLEEKGALGDDVHEMLRLYDLENLDEKETAKSRPDLIPYLECWKRFLSNENIGKFSLIEESLYSIVYNYCGTLDRWYGITQYEIKTGVYIEDYEALQTVGYDGLIRENLRISRTRKTKRISIHLEPDNPKLYTPHEFTYHGDFNDFMSCQNVLIRQKRRAR